MPVKDAMMNVRDVMTIALRKMGRKVRMITNRNRRRRKKPNAIL